MRRRTCCMISFLIWQGLWSVGNSIAFSFISDGVIGQYSAIGCRSPSLSFRSSHPASRLHDDACSNPHQSTARRSLVASTKNRVLFDLASNFNDQAVLHLDAVSSHSSASTYCRISLKDRQSRVSSKCVLALNASLME